VKNVPGENYLGIIFQQLEPTDTTKKAALVLNETCHLVVMTSPFQFKPENEPPFYNAKINLNCNATQKNRFSTTKQFSPKQ